jgi:hypothetical protein
MSDAPVADPVADPAPTPDPDPAPRTFTQDELDRIVRDRLARQKAQFGDYDELKEAADRLKEIEDQNKSELAKAQERAAELERKAAEAEQARLAALYENAVISEAAKKNVADPTDLVQLIDRSAVEFGDDGRPTNISDVVDSLLKAKPYLAGGGHALGDADLGARGGGVEKPITREQLARMSSAEITAATADGRLSHLLNGD